MDAAAVRLAPGGTGAIATFVDGRLDNPWRHHCRRVSNARWQLELAQHGPRQRCPRRPADRNRHHGHVVALRRRLGLLVRACTLGRRLR